MRMDSLSSFLPILSSFILVRYSKLHDDKIGAVDSGMEFISPGGGARARVMGRRSTAMKVGG